MTKNNYITTREYETSIVRIENRLDKIDEKFDNLQVSFVALKTKFNDELSDAVSKGKWKYGIAMASLGGAVSLIISLVV